MVGDALKLKKNFTKAQSFLTRPRETLWKCALHKFAKGDRRSGRRISRARLGKRDLPRKISVGGDNRLFNSAVLVAEKNLEIVNILAHALKAEMPRFDDARVNGPYRHLVCRRPFKRGNAFWI